MLICSSQQHSGEIESQRGGNFSEVTHLGDGETELELEPTSESLQSLCC